MLRRSTAFAVVFYAALAVAGTWPVAAHLDGAIPTSTHPADPLQIFYGFVWGTRALLTDPGSYLNATFFYPYPHSLSFLDQLFALCLMGMPAMALTGDWVLAYNLVWMATFVLSGLGAFLLTRRLTGSVPGGLLAGTLFALYPFRYHNAGLLHMEAIFWYPFVFLALHRWVELRSHRYFVAAVALSILQFACSGYTGVFLAVAVVLFFAVRLIFDGKATLGLWRVERRRILITVVLGLVALVPLAAPPAYNAVEGLGFGDRSLGASALFSAVPADFLTPAPQSPLGRAVEPLPGARHPLFPGIVGALLVLFWFVTRGWRDHPRRVDMIFYTALLVAGCLLALGPALAIGGTRIPMPFAVLYYVLPGVSMLRAPVRFVSLAMIAGAVLSGAAMHRLAPGPRTRWLSLGAVLLTVAELVAIPITVIDPYFGGLPAAYRHLEGEPGSAVIADLPMPATEADEDTDHVRYQLYSLFHGKRLVNGIAAMVPPVTREIRTAIQAFPDGESVRALRDVGVSWIFLHGDRYPPAELEAIRAALPGHPELEPAAEEGPVLVIRIRPTETGGP